MWGNNYKINHKPSNISSRKDSSTPHPTFSSLPFLLILQVILQNGAIGMREGKVEGRKNSGKHISPFLTGRSFTWFYLLWHSNSVWSFHYSFKSIIVIIKMNKICKIICKGPALLHTRLSSCLQHQFPVSACPIHSPCTHSGNEPADERHPPISWMLSLILSLALLSE